MLRKIFYSVFFCVLSFISMSQTIQPAKMLPPQLKKEAVVNISSDKLWELISVNDNIKKYNPLWVKSVEKEGDGLDSYRLCKFSDGTQRAEEIVVFHPEGKHICYSSKKTQYSTSHFCIHYYVKDAGKSKSKISMAAYFKLNPAVPKTKTYKAIAKEMSLTVKALQNYFK
ncbi:MAG: hypothetical protein N4A49_14605 [Marinifilaceae bacterium]|jgi:hypothetical protein|nr:hypothetical protein [Marinifilaceae bacterium]